MKKYFYGLLPLCLFVLTLTGCDDTETVISIGESRSLTAEISTPSAIFGDDVTFTVKIDQQDNKLSLEEDIDVNLTFTGKDKNQKELTAADVFENFSGHIFMKKGEKQGFADFKVKSNLPNYPITGTITAYVRGYQMNGAERAIVISDKHYTIMSLKNNSDNTVNEYGKFILVATVGAPAKEDVTVAISTTAENADKFDGLPDELVIKAGYRTAESDFIQIVGKRGTNDFESVSMSFATASEVHPMYEDKLELKVIDMDAGLEPGTELYNEKWVYTNPDQIFVSAGNKKAVSNWDEIRAAEALEIKEGDPHPNMELAAAGWTFLNSYEFHPIDELTQGGKGVNEFGNRPPRYMAAQNVANTQKVQAVVNDKYATMTQDGHLKMWCAYDPGLACTGETTGTRDYGVSAIYASKFDGVPTGADSWESSNVRILPGTRVEVRIRIRGKKHSFNSAVWFQGNIRGVQWSTYGEVDLLENPANKNGSMNNSWLTFHWNEQSTVSGDKYNPTSGALNIPDMDEFDIYWMEWRDNNEIVLGLNGLEKVRINKGYRGSNHWPFTDEYNPEGLHLLLTFAGCNEWSLGEAAAEAAAKDGSWANDFKHITYQESKTSNDTPRMEIDWIRFYKKSNYQYYGSGTPTRNVPMY